MNYPGTQIFSSDKSRNIGESRGLLTPVSVPTIGQNRVNPVIPSPSVSSSSNPINFKATPLPLTPVSLTSSPSPLSFSTSTPISLTSTPISLTSTPISLTSTPISLTSTPISLTSSNSRGFTPIVLNNPPPVQAVERNPNRLFLPILSKSFNNPGGNPQLRVGEVRCGRTERGVCYPSLNGFSTIPAYSRGLKDWKGLSPMLLGPIEIIEPILVGTIEYKDPNRKIFFRIVFDGTVAPGYTEMAEKEQQQEINYSTVLGYSQVELTYRLIRTGRLQWAQYNFFESYWQYGKIYAIDIDHTGKIKPDFWNRRAIGISQLKAKRRALSKTKAGIPISSYYQGEVMDYITSRTKIYIPMYKNLVERNPAFLKLSEMHKNGKNLLIIGPDGLNNPIELTKEIFTSMITRTDMIFGHELVLVGMLMGWL